MAYWTPPTSLDSRLQAGQVAAKSPLLAGINTAFDVGSKVVGIAGGLENIKTAQQGRKIAAAQEDRAVTNQQNKEIKDAQENYSRMIDNLDKPGRLRAEATRREADALAKKLDNEAKQAGIDKNEFVEKNRQFAATTAPIYNRLVEIEANNPGVSEKAKRDYLTGALMSSNLPPKLKTQLAGLDDTITVDEFMTGHLTVMKNSGQEVKGIGTDVTARRKAKAEVELKELDIKSAKEKGYKVPTGPPTVKEESAIDKKAAAATATIKREYKTPQEFKTALAKAESSQDPTGGDKRVLRLAKEAGVSSVFRAWLEVVAGDTQFSGGSGQTNKLREIAEKNRKKKGGF